MKLDALIMAGGKGTRLGANTEKPLLQLRGKCLVDYVLQAAMKCGRIDRFWAVTSPHTEKTERYLAAKSVQVLRAPGNGYVEDLIFTMENLGMGKTLVISADLPLLTSRDLDWAIEEYQNQDAPAMAVMVPINAAEKSGARPDTIIDGHVSSGLNVVDGKNLNGDEFKLVTNKPQFAINVNTAGDLKQAIRRMKNAH